jgi:hypothetical protein
MKLSAFAHALDIVLADGALVAEEANFLNELSARLDLADEDVRRLAEVMAIKNKYSAATRGVYGHGV